jgi:uncharacterized repeat protein (TIGR02543 family)
MEYRAVHNLYNYSKTWQGTEYNFSAAEFVIELVWAGTDTPSGPKVVLRSRSANATSITPYFEAYIQNEDTTTEAFRSDPAWFHYPMDIDQALTQTDPALYRMGDLVTPDSQFWLDIDGGSEMGGKTFKLITGSLSNTELNGLATSFISQFAVQYTDENAILRQLLFCPHVYSISALTNTVTYDGNGNTGGTVPVDPNSPYVSGATVTVLGNTGNLARTGYVFAGWNTAANGSGTSYAVGSHFTMPAANVILYAQWISSPPIPTMSECGAIILITLLAGVGLWEVGRRNRRTLGRV